MAEQGNESDGQQPLLAADTSDSPSTGEPPPAPTENNPAQQRPSHHRSVWPILLAALVVTVVVIEVWDVSQARLIIEPFAVPKQLSEKQGLSSQVLANKLKDELSNVKHAYDIHKDTRDEPDQKKPPRSRILEEGPARAFTVHDFSPRRNIQIPALGVSPRGLAEWLTRKFESVSGLDLPNERLTGEVEVVDKELRLIIRINGVSITQEVITAPLHEVHAAMSEAAEAVYPHLVAILGGVPRRCDNTEEFVNAYEAIGNDFLNAGLNRSALSAFEFARRQCAGSIDDRKYVWFHYSVADAYWYMERYDEAIATYAVVSKLDPTNELALSSIGLAHMELGNFEAAARRLRQALEIRNDESYWWTKLGTALAEQGKLEEAEEAFHQSTRLDSGIASPWREWGKALHVANRNTEAAQKLERAVSIEPKDSGALQAWGWALMDAGDYKQALEKLHWALELEPWNVGIRLDVANLLVSMYRFDEATALLRQLIEDDETWAEPYVAWCRALHDMSRYDSAVVKCKKALELEPEAADTWMTWGDILYWQNDYDGAIAKYRQALHVDESHVGARVGWANSLGAKKEIDAALSKLESALRSTKGRLAAHRLDVQIAMIEALILARRYGDAQSMLDDLQSESVLSQRSYFAAVLLLKAWVLAEQGLHQEAQELCDEASRTDPYNLWAWTDLGDNLAEQSKFELAYGAYETAVMKNPHDPWAYTRWGWALMKEKKPKEAVRKLLAAIDVDPFSTDAWVELARAYLALDEPDRALSSLAHAHERDRFDATVLVASGDVLAHTGRKPEAIEKYKQAARLDATEVQGLLNLAELLQQAGDLASARSAYKRALERDPGGKLGKSAREALRQLLGQSGFPGRIPMPRYPRHHLLPIPTAEQWLLGAAP